MIIRSNFELLDLLEFIEVRLLFKGGVYILFYLYSQLQRLNKCRVYILSNSQLRRLNKRGIYYILSVLSTASFKRGQRLIKETRTRAPDWSYVT